MEAGSKEDTYTIVRGDFNYDLTEAPMANIINTCERMGSRRLKSNTATHYAGRITDHLFFPEDAPPERTFVTVIPPETKDHAIIIDRTTRKSWATTETPKSILDFYASDPNFRGGNDRSG
jgi:hypothetical protein